VHPPLPFAGSPAGPCDKMAFKESCLRKGRIKYVTDKGSAALEKTTTFVVFAAHVLNQGCFLKDEERGGFSLKHLPLRVQSRKYSQPLVSPDISRKVQDKASR